MAQSKLLERAVRQRHIVISHTSSAKWVEAAGILYQTKKRFRKKEEEGGAKELKIFVLVHHHICLTEGTFMAIGHTSNQQAIDK